jgi:hypothetical protein
MTFWKNIFKKQDMEKIQEGDLKTKDFIQQDLSNFKFQKVTGGRATKFLRLDEKNGKRTVHFADGSSTDFKLLEERYVRLSLNQPDFSDDQIKQLVESRRKKAREGVAPLLSDEERILAGNESTVSASSVTINPIVTQRPESALQQLLKKQKENMVSLNLNLNVNLPPKALFDVLLDSYENAEAEILAFAVSKIDIEAIKNSVKEAIKENYYKTNGQN